MRVFILLLAGFLFVSVGFDYVFSHPPVTSAEISTQLDDEGNLGQSPTPQPSPTPIWPFAEQLMPASPSASGPHPDPLLKGEGSYGDDFCLDVPVLLYHHIQPLSEAQKLGQEKLTVDNSIFDKQMHYLVEQGYTAISAEDLIVALQNWQKVPEKSVVITIDDGYIDTYSYAFMMAKKYNLTMNFMISTELVGKPGYMTWDHLREMAQNPLAKIYNHTASHAALGLLSKQEIESELIRSREQLRSQLGIETNIFTYPYGSFSLLAIDMLYKHGFAGAYSTMHGRKQCVSDIMLLHRDHVGNAPLTEYGL